MTRSAAQQHPVTEPLCQEPWALATSGDIRPGPGQLLVRLDPLTAPRRTQALAALCEQLNQSGCTYPGTDLLLRYEVKTHPGPT